MKLLILIFVLVMLSNSSVQAGPIAEARKAILVTEARIAILAEVRQSNAAFLRGDMNGVLADTTPDYVQITSSGTVYSREQVRQEGRTLLAKTRVKHYSEHTSSFQLISRNEVIVDGTSLFIFSLYSPSAGRYVTISMSSVVRAYWVRTAYGWRMKQSRVLSSQKRLG